MNRGTNTFFALRREEKEHLFSIYVTKIGSFKSQYSLGDMKKVKKMELGMKHTQDLKRDLALKQDLKKKKMNPLLLLTLK